MTARDTAHAFAFRSISGGEPLPLAAFSGRFVLVVNTASRCGFTPQFAKLQALWDTYRERGLVVLGVPCNDFGSQEPLAETDIAAFCDARFGVSFPMAAKERVVGPDAHPFYRWANAQVGVLGRPRWNFHKYLIDRQGALADWFSTVTDPAATRFTRRIEAMLEN